ncbi:MAG: 4Fe-4S binding protein [Oligoflexia bacterium]|nr:4Fe-4S binding protein [Oligoflexia bacterium]
MKYVALFRTIKRAVQLILSNREVTERYPDPIARPILPKRTRGFIAIDVQKCSLCGICERDCPSGAISISENESLLTLDYSKCFFCGYCVEACPEKAMVFSKEFEGASNNKETFKYKFHIFMT